MKESNVMITVEKYIVTKMKKGMLIWLVGNGLGIQRGWMKEEWRRMKVLYDVNMEENTKRGVTERLSRIKFRKS